MKIPPGFSAVTPYFFVKDANRFIEFLKEGLGGKVTESSKRPNGSILNAHVMLGSSTVMISEATTDYPPMQASYYFYVDDADGTVAKAIAAGGTLEMAVADMLMAIAKAALKTYMEISGGFRSALKMARTECNRCEL